jgi:hypothetical protein
MMILANAIIGGILGAMCSKFGLSFNQALIILGLSSLFILTPLLG